ncbi:MAG: hypothetical protein WC082_15760 [Victivallales bacterium]
MTDEEYYGEEEIEILCSAVDRKLIEISSFGKKLSESDSTESKKKYENIIDLLYSDIVGYKTAISEITGEAFSIADLDYDTDMTPEYDAEEVYDMYLEELDEASRSEDMKQMGLKAEFFRDLIDQSYYSAGLRVLSDESLRREVMDYDAVLINIGKAVMEEDSLRKHFL